MNNGIWHIPWINEGTSESEHCHFLFQKNKIYIMDNHRLALWCWLRELDLKQSFNFLHIDAHDDCLVHPNMGDFQLSSMGLDKLDTYMNYKDPLQENSSLFRWDNYLPFFFLTYKNIINKKIIFGHDLGLAGDFTFRHGPWDLYRFSNKMMNWKPWVVNIDLDYFYARDMKNHLLFSQDYMSNFFDQLSAYYDEGVIKLITVALSPECCGGWDQSLKALELFNKSFNLKMKRPK